MSRSHEGMTVEESGPLHAAASAEEESINEQVDVPPQFDNDDDDAPGPAFVDMNDAIEVQVDEEDVPMEEEEDEEEQDDVEAVPQELSSPTPNIVDMAKAKFESHTGPVYSIAGHFDAATQTLSILSGGGDDKAFLYRFVAGHVPATAALAHAHTDSVSCAAFNMDYVSEDLSKTPRLAAVGGYDGAIVLYDPDTGAKIKEFDGPSDVEWLCFHPKGGSVLLAGSSADGTVWMYHVPLNKCLQVFVGHESGVTAGSFTPDGRWALSASSDGTLRVWAPKTGVGKHIFRLAQEGAGLTCLAVNGGTDGQLVIVGAEDGMAHVCHVGTKKVVADLRHFETPLSANDEDEEIDLPMSVEAVGFASAAVNVNWCATGGVDGVLKIWDLANNGQCRQICRPEPNDNATVAGITRLQWHPTQPLVFTSSADGAVRLWDARNGGLLQTLTGHSDMINDMGAVFTNVENQGGTAIIFSGSDDKTVRVFEVNVGSALAQTSLKARR